MILSAQPNKALRITPRIPAFPRRELKQLSKSILACRRPRLR